MYRGRGDGERKRKVLNRYCVCIATVSLSLSFSRHLSSFIGLVHYPCTISKHYRKFWIPFTSCDLDIWSNKTVSFLHFCYNSEDTYKCLEKFLAFWNLYFFKFHCTTIYAKFIITTDCLFLQKTYNSSATFYTITCRWLRKNMMNVPQLSRKWGRLSVINKETDSVDSVWK